MLNNRSQKVYANGVLSEPLPVLSGTPQGAALSPILFAIFMGEVGDIIEEQLKEEDQGKDVIRSREDAGLWTLMFGDDTKAAGSMKSNDQMELIQAVLGRFYNWVQCNDMLINGGKTEALRVGKLKKEGTYKTPEGKDVKWVTQAKDLGIYFSETGDWKVHIHHVRTSIMKKAGWILRTFGNRDIKFLKFCWNT